MMGSYICIRLGSYCSRIVTTILVVIAMGWHRFGLEVALLRIYCTAIMYYRSMIQLRRSSYRFHTYKK